MGKIKTNFKLEWASGTIVPDVEVKIIGQRPDHKPYLSINAFSDPMIMPDKDLERFAVNILKALGSKHLKKRQIKWKQVPAGETIKKYYKK